MSSQSFDHLHDEMLGKKVKRPVAAEKTYTRQDKQCRTYFLAPAFEPVLGRWIPSAALSLFLLLAALVFAALELQTGTLEQSLAPGGHTRTILLVFLVPTTRLLASLAWRVYCKKKRYGLEVQLFPNIAPEVGGSYRGMQRNPGYRVRYRNKIVESGRIEPGTLAMLTTIGNIGGTNRFARKMNFVSLKSQNNRPFLRWFPSVRAFENGWYHFMRRDAFSISNVYSHAKEIVDYLDLPQGYVPQLIVFESDICREDFKDSYAEGPTTRQGLPPL